IADDADRRAAALLDEPVDDPHGAGHDRIQGFATGPLGEAVAVVVGEAAHLVERLASRITEIDLLELFERLDRDATSGRDLLRRVLRPRQRARDDAIEGYGPEGRRDDLRLLAALGRERAVGLSGEHLRGVRLALP